MRSILILILFPLTLWGQLPSISSNMNRYTVDVPPVIFDPPRDYYIAQGGVGDGLTSGSPASEALLISASGTFVPGDRIYLNRGDVFEIGHLLASDIHDFQIQPYGSGADPIVYGSEDISDSFVDNGDGTYYRTMSRPIFVFIGGDAARLAQSAWYQVDSQPADNVRSIAAATLAGLSTVVGADIIFKQFNFRLTTVREVTAENDANGNVTFTPALSGVEGISLKFLNQGQFLSAQNDWYYNTTNGRLYVKSTTNPNSLDIRATFDQIGFEIVRVNDLLIDNIEFAQYQTTGIQIQSCDDPVITNCNFHDIRGEAVNYLGTTSNIVFNDNILDKIDLRGVQFSGVAGGQMNRNTVSNIGNGETVGFPLNANLTTAIAFTLGGNLVSGPVINSDFEFDQNTFTNIGYVGIHWWGPNFSITRNVFDTYCTDWTDGGAIHLIYRTSGASSTSNGLLQNNIVINGIGNGEGTASASAPYAAGLYVDNGCNNITLDNNTVYKCSGSGILANWDTKQTTITDNNVMAAEDYQLWIRQDTDIGDSPVWPNNNGNIVTGNILAVRKPTTRCVSAMTFNSTTSYNPFSSGGDSDNNHYVNPYGVNVANYINVSTITDYTLVGWRTKMGDDASSTERTNYITYSNDTNAQQEVKIEINATASPVNFNVPAGYTDYSGAAFSNPVSIPAYSSLIYFKDTASP